MTKHDILLDVQHLSHVFPLTKQVSVKALDDISFQIRRGGDFRPCRRVGFRQVDGRALRDGHLAAERRAYLLQWRRPL